MGARPGRREIPTWRRLRKLEGRREVLDTAEVRGIHLGQVGLDVARLGGGRVVVVAEALVPHAGLAEGYLDVPRPAFGRPAGQCDHGAVGGEVAGAVVVDCRRG